jgi:general secretion pathway protein G
MKSHAHCSIGFTLIELLVVMAIVAVLLSIVSPHYFHSIGKAEEAVLKQDLSIMREALDKYHADIGKYPDVLGDLVTKKYIRNIPVDPITESNLTWVLIPPSDSQMGGIFDIKSGASGIGRSGTAYADW